MITLAVAVVLLLAASWYVFRKELAYKLAPGPWGLPVVGHLPFLGSHPHVTFMAMQKQYGDVFRIRLGSFPALVVNGGQAIKEALTKTGDDFIARPAFQSNREQGYHVAFGLYRPSWKVHKKLTMNVLSQFVSERHTAIQNLMDAEITALVEDVLAKGEKPFDPENDLYTFTCGVPYKLCYGRDENVRESSDFKMLLVKEKAFIDFAGAGNPVDVLPWLRFVMPWVLKGIREVTEFSAGIRQKMVQQHRDTLREDEPRDITDVILSTDYDNPELRAVGFTEEMFLTTLDDVIEAGFDTTGTVLRWLLLYMVLHPDLQESVHDEIDEVIGDSRLPRLGDRKFLPLTEATVMEMMRFKTPIPISVPHSALRDTRVHGYDVPKDTVILFNLHSIAHDPDVWTDPGEFRPKRFLNSDGTLNTTLTKVILPFSAGPRKCPGDTLALNEIFLAFTALTQRFQFCSCQSQYDTLAVHGLTDYPNPYSLIARARA